MGQRHQVFAIARVRAHGSTTAQYRCVAAFHHQWCYGSLPLKATRRFLDLVKKKENAEIIMSEIRTIQGKYGRWTEEPELPDLPCPFISLLLALSWSVDLNDPKQTYSHATSVVNGSLPADMGSSEGDNNDGISVVDITDPASPAYCFVSIGGLEARRPTATFYPLSATDYGRAYYPVPEPDMVDNEGSKRSEALILPSITALAEERMVELWMLAEAWPSEYQRSLRKHPRSTSDDSGSVATPIPSLTDISMNLAIQHAVQKGETTEIEGMLWIPDKASVVKSALLEFPEIPDGAIELLIKLIGAEAEKAMMSLDLSGYCLSTDQIVKVASVFESVEALNISHNPRVTTATIQDLLSALPRLKRLVMMDCPSITQSDLAKLLADDPKLFYHLETLVHPLFLELDPHDVYSNTFSLISSSAHGSRGFAGRTIPFFSLTSIFDNLTTFFECIFLAEDPWTASELLVSHISMEAVLSASSRKEAQSWSDRSVVVSPYVSLGGFLGQGWVFAFDFPSYGASSWAFLKFGLASQDESSKNIVHIKSGDRTISITFELYDIRAFLHALSDMKAPPPEEKIVKLEEMLKPGEKIQMMKEDEVEHWVQTVIESSQRYV